MTTAERRKQERQFNEAVGARLKAARVLAGMSQGDVAKVLGLSWQQIAKYESGVNRIYARTLVTLAGVLNTHPMHILADQSGGMTSLTRSDLWVMRRLARLTLEQKQAVGAMLDAFLHDESTQTDERKQA